MVELFGQPFAVSVAPAELARASGCVILPVYLTQDPDGRYGAHVLPQIEYERAALRELEARRDLSQRIVRAFEPVIREHLDEWYHFVPLWPEDRGATIAGSNSASPRNERFSVPGAVGSGTGGKDSPKREGNKP